MSDICLLSFINFVGYLISVYLLNKYEVDVKFPRIKKVIRYFEKSTLIFVIIEGLICLICLLSIVGFSFLETAKEYDDIYDKTTDWLNNVKPKFLDDFSVLDNINDLINNFKDYVTTLNVEQLLSLINILSACFILLSLFDIFLINLGNELIDYFALEDKFPKLAKFIRLRKKITKYNNIINYLIIILALLFIIYVNLLVLTS